MQMTSMEYPNDKQMKLNKQVKHTSKDENKDFFLKNTWKIINTKFNRVKILQVK